MHWPLQTVRQRPKPHLRGQRPPQVLRQQLLPPVQKPPTRLLGPHLLPCPSACLWASRGRTRAGRRACGSAWTSSSASQVSVASRCRVIAADNARLVSSRSVIPLPGAPPIWTACAVATQAQRRRRPGAWAASAAWRRQPLHAMWRLFGSSWAWGRALTLRLRSSTLHWTGGASPACRGCPQACACYLFGC